MDIAATQQAEISAAIRRAAIVDSDRRRPFSVTHLLQFVGTLFIGVALLLAEPTFSIGLGAVGAGAITVALCRNPSTSDSEVDRYFDESTGLALASALPMVVRDEQAMASLTGRVAVLMVDVHGATSRLRRGDERGASALMTMVLHRLEGHSWASPIGGSFSPLFFLETPATIVIVRRDLLGDQSNQWLTERLLDDISKPLPGRSGPLQPDISIGGATGPVSDGPSLVTLAALARRDARAGGVGSVTVRALEAPRRVRRHPIEVVADDRQTPIGLFFESSDPGRRVGIFEHLASLRATFHHAVRSVADTGARPLIAASVTALSHPAAATDLMQRATAAGGAGRVGLVLPADFPTNPGHRAVGTVEKLHRAGFLIVADRREMIDHLKTLPFVPIDVVMVGPEFDLGTRSKAGWALLDAVRERHAAVVFARTSVQVDAIEMPLALSEGAYRLNQGGRPDHLAKAGSSVGR